MVTRRVSEDLLAATKSSLTRRVTIAETAVREVEAPSETYELRLSMFRAEPQPPKRLCN